MKIFEFQYLKNNEFFSIEIKAKNQGIAIAKFKTLTENDKAIKIIKIIKR